MVVSSPEHCNKSPCCVWDSLSMRSRLPSKLQCCPQVYNPASVAIHTSSPSTQQVDAGRSWIGQQIGFQASLGYIVRPRLKNTINLWSSCPLYPPYPLPPPPLSPPTTTWDYKWVPQCLTEIPFLVPGCLLYLNQQQKKKISVCGGTPVISALGKWR